MMPRVSSIVGHPEVTRRAYAQDPATIDRAVRFATAAIANGLDRAVDITTAQRHRLVAQIERDFLVSLLERTGH